jgi:hypothetical protein
MEGSCEYNHVTNIKYSKPTEDNIVEQSPCSAIIFPSCDKVLLIIYFRVFIHLRISKRHIPRDEEKINIAHKEVDIVISYIGERET